MTKRLLFSNIIVIIVFIFFGFACGGGNVEDTPDNLLNENDTTEDEPVAPTDLQVVVGDKQLTVSWVEVKKPDTYVVLCGTEDIYPDSWDYRDETTQRTHAFTGLSNGQKYNIRVIASNYNDLGSWSEQVSGVPVPDGTISNIKVEELGYSIKISWNSMQGAKGYYVYYSYNNDISYESSRDFIETTETIFDYSSDTRKRYYAVTAKFEGGYETALSNIISGQPSLDQEEILKLTAYDATTMSQFGYSISTYYPYFAVGAPGDSERGSNSGAVYLYKEAESGDIEFVQKITSLDQDENDNFGKFLSFSEDVLYIGAPNDNRGAVYTFAPNEDGTWVQRSKYRKPDVLAYGYGSLIADRYTSAPLDRQLGMASGAVFSEGDKLVASDGGAYDYFGTSVIGRTREGFMFIGAPGADKVYYFKKEHSDWIESDIISVDDDKTSFGFSMSLYEDKLMVSAPESDAVFEFDCEGEYCEYVRKIKLDDLYHQYFGYDLYLSLNKLYVSAPGEIAGNNGGTIHIYEYDEEGAIWERRGELTASDGLVGDRFGHTFVFSYDIILVGAPNDDAQSGAVYIFN